jgi:hypothetical protein
MLTPPKVELTFFSFWTGWLNARFTGAMDTAARAAELVKNLLLETLLNFLFSIVVGIYLVFIL